MRTLLLLALLVSSNVSFAQKVKWDTSISFTRLKGRWLTESRMVYGDSRYPLYIAIPYEGTDNLNYEYFRVDSAHYLFREYFPNADHYYFSGVKSNGIKIVQSTPKPDTILVDRFSVTGEKIGTSYQVEYRKSLAKEGEWLEYEDSTQNLVFWKGNYINDRRTGVWKRLIGDDRRIDTIEEVDYGKDSTKNIYSKNLANIASIDSVKKMMAGVTWLLRYNEDFDKKTVAFYDRCTALPSGLCGQGNYYRFDMSGSFTRNLANGSQTAFPELTSAKWELIRQGDQWVIKITFTNGQVWQFKVLYLDKNYRFLTQRI